MFRKRRKENTTCRQNIYMITKQRYIWIKESFMEDIMFSIALQATRDLNSKEG